MSNFDRIPIVVYGIPYEFTIGENGEFLNSYGEPWKSKIEYPYSYDPIHVYGNPNVKATSTVYSDRLVQWDGEKYNRICQEMFGRYIENWSDHSNKAEEFLQRYFEKPEIKVAAIIEYCNPSNGYPYWRIDYAHG